MSGNRTVVRFHLRRVKIIIKYGIYTVKWPILASSQLFSYRGFRASLYYWKDLRSIPSDSRRSEAKKRCHPISITLPMRTNHHPNIQSEYPRLDANTQPERWHRPEHPDPFMSGGDCKTSPQKGNHHHQIRDIHSQMAYPGI